MPDQNKGLTKVSLDVELLPVSRKPTDASLFDRGASYEAEIRIGDKGFVAFLCLIAASLAFDLICIWLLADALGQPIYLSWDWVTCCYSLLTM